MINQHIFDGRPITFTPNKDGTWKLDKSITIRNTNDGTEYVAELCIPRCNVNFNSMSILAYSTNKKLWDIIIPNDRKKKEVKWKV